MADLIDREQLTNAMRDLFCFNEAGEYTFLHIKCVIDEQPSVDAEPVRHGQFIVPVPGDGEPYCAVCKSYQLYIPYVGYFQSKYCPYCGAKMDVKEQAYEG